LESEEETMSLPTSYLTTTKNLEAILNSLQGAKAPTKFTVSFLESLEFKSKTDRLVIGVLKALGFVTEGGEPTQRYYEFLDQTQGGRVLAEAIEEAYSDLFQVNKEAHKLTTADVKNKLKTLTQGQHSDAVLGWMANTFTALCARAEFDLPKKQKPVKEQPTAETVQEGQHSHDTVSRKGLSINGLQYVINLQLPESRDPAVYDALFRSMREHLEGD
jgi:hypothetical protein